MVILQNTKVLPEDQGPKTWADLLDPEVEGQDRLHRSRQLGLGLLDRHHARRPLRRRRCGLGQGQAAARQHPVLNRSSLVFQGVGNGEYPLGISLEYAGYVWAAGGAPVKTIYPADGTIAQMEGVAVIKGGPNAEAAKAFVDYINRKDVREMIIKETFRRPARQDLELAKLPGSMPAAVEPQAAALQGGGLDGGAGDRRSKRSKTWSRKPVDRRGSALSKIAIEGVRRSFGSVEAVRDVTLRIEDGEFFTLLGPVGLRQDHAAAHDRRLHRARRRRDPHRRTAHRHPAAASAQHRHGVPELRDLSQPHRGRQRRLRPQGAQGCRRGDRRARRRCARPGSAAGLRRALAAPALRRPAAARRHRPRPGHSPRGAAARRAAVQSRCAAAGRHARRDPRAAAAPEHHHRLRDARPGGGAGRLRTASP